MTKFHKGDDVSWKTSQGETSGTVERTTTKPLKIKNNNIEASKENPKVVVKSAKTGAEAAHKPDALKKN
ncbi:DUF2945 domain-containing protein [Kozakia baliensis]|uniref:DUF2945 domain-containing protein n=1 Tax=Kozakia baliensis TaxID=153496 RepID=UPI00049726C9|nr:DUF2945 domain-containing protein [Kozakia baliensis]